MQEMVKMKNGANKAVTFAIDGQKYTVEPGETVQVRKNLTTPRHKGNPPIIRGICKALVPADEPKKSAPKAEAPKEEPKAPAKKTARGKSAKK